MFNELEEKNEKNLFLKNMITNEQIERYHSIRREEAAKTPSRKRITPKVVYPTEPKYIADYRNMLSNPDTVPSIMLKEIKRHGSIIWKDLKRILIQQYGYKASGSLDASLRLLRLDKHIEIDGKGEDKMIRSLKNPFPVKNISQKKTILLKRKTKESSIKRD